MKNNNHTFEPALTVLCAGTIAKADFITRVKSAKRAGFDSLSLFPQHYLNARQREKLSMADMRAVLNDHAMRIITIDPLLDWFGPQQSQAETLVYEVAEAVEAPAINLAPAFAPNISQQQVVDTFARVCERAASKGLRVDLEILPWTVIPDYPSLFDIIKAANQPNAFITLDCLHFFRSGGVIGDLEAQGAEGLQKVSNIQLCDITREPQALNWRQKLAANRVMMATAWDGIRTTGFKAMMNAGSKAHTTRKDANVLMQEAMCTRVQPGQGDIPVREIVQTFQRLGCQPQMGMEIFSLALNKLSPFEAAQQTMTAYRQLAQ